MNPSYQRARFRALLPDGGAPDIFAIVTACNPDGETIPDTDNAARTEAFRQQLVLSGHPHFPVAGYDPNSAHCEAGFGIVCDRETAIELGNQWRQEAIFMIENGRVILVSCSDGFPETDIAAWEERLG